MVALMQSIYHCAAVLRCKMFTPVSNDGAREMLGSQFILIDIIDNKKIASAPTLSQAWLVLVSV